LVPKLDWVFAVTYAEGAPHEYVVAGRTSAFTAADCVRACRVIRTFGEPGKFFKDTRTYWVDDAGWKYWDMADGDVETSGLINRARVEHVYGVQNAPRTKSGTKSSYDPVATDWDRSHAGSDRERRLIAELIGRLGTFTKRRVLDIGCGTGLTLDLGITESVRYVGIDPSQAMLNELVRKHSPLAGIHPMSFTQAVASRVLGGTRFDLVLALGGSASYLSKADLTAIAKHAAGPIVLTAFADGHEPFVDDLSPARLADSREQIVAFSAAYDGTVTTAGRLSIAVIPSVQGA
jgi:SAM-dependent methyltransferase